MHDVMAYTQYTNRIQTMLLSTHDSSILFELLVGFGSRANWAENNGVAIHMSSIAIFDFVCMYFLFDRDALRSTL